MLYVYDLNEVGFIRILNLVMLLECSSYSSNLMSGIGGGLVCACKSALIQLSFWAIFMVICLVLEERILVSSHIVTLNSAVRVS